MNEAQILDSLDLGMSKAVLENRPSSPMGDLLSGLAQEVIDQLKVSIDKYNISTPSANLKQSLSASEAIIDGDAVTVNVSAAFYWKLVNYGVNGFDVNHGAPDWDKQPATGMTFKESIDAWIINRGITKPESFSNYDSFSFAIMHAIRRDGKAPRPFFTDVVNKGMMKALKNPIEKLLKRSIQIKILDPWQ
jgi:hypothetical protein